MTITEEIIDVPAEHIRNVFGEFDNHIKRIERTMNVTILARGGSLKVIGSESAATRAASVIGQLVNLSARGSVITEQNVN